MEEGGVEEGDGIDETMNGNYEMHRKYDDTDERNEGESEVLQHKDPSAEAVQLTQDGSPSEALAASGLRAFPYVKEVEQIGSVVACGNDEVAIKGCERSIQLKGKVALAKMTAKHADSRVIMLTHEKESIVGNLDPYGSLSIFSDLAVQSISEGDLLSCTATDVTALWKQWRRMLFQAFNRVRGR